MQKQSQYNLKVKSPFTKVDGNILTTEYNYQTSDVQIENGTYIVTPKSTKYEFKTDLKVPKLGVMLVGWGGNNGSTVTAGILANKHNICWETKKGKKTPNFYGSITQSSTTKIGLNGCKEVFLPLNGIVPMVDPKEMVLGGWDISKFNLADAMKRAQVVDFNLQEKLRPYMEKMQPLKGVYYPHYIAQNQKDRADNYLPGDDKWAHLQQIKQDIIDFKAKNKCDKVIIMWSANTECFSKLIKGQNDTWENLKASIKASHENVSASTIFAAATILAGCSFINGSPQNTLVPGVIELARQEHQHIIGDDFKTGQTKFKTAFTDFLVNAGIKPTSVVSYNHLGNNDGKNLSSNAQFQSKKKSKSNCINSIIESNQVLFPTEESRKIDHEVVIKYVPSAGDSKKAIDEYISEIFLGGQHVFASYNVCEDSLLAAPIIMDLIILSELMQRVQWRRQGMQQFGAFDAVLTTLGYLMKAPLTNQQTPVINSLYRQRQAIENLLKACAGIPPCDNTLLSFRCLSAEKQLEQNIQSKKVKRKQSILSEDTLSEDNEVKELVQSQ